MQIVRLFVVNNTSSPAKTQMNDHNFEFFMPPGAKIEQVQARAPNGQPIAAEASPKPKKIATPSPFRCESCDTIATAAASPATLVQPPTETWRPPAAAQTSDWATGANAIGARAIPEATTSTAASFFMSEPFADVGTLFIAVSPGMLKG